MDPVSPNVERMAALLRQRLMEREKLRKAGENAGAGQARGAVGSRAVSPLLELGGLDATRLERALIENILVEGLGSDMINEARFQQVVDRVTHSLRSDPGTAALLSKMASEVRAAAS
jgi:hypothetical protein